MRDAMLAKIPGKSPSDGSPAACAYELRGIRAALTLSGE